MLVYTDMADFIRTSMGFSPPTSTQLKGWSNGICTHLITQGLCNIAPGLVTGICPAGGSLINGAATNGLIVGLDYTVLAPLVVGFAGYPFPSTILLAFCQQIVIHIETLGRVSFASGNITAICTNTALSPGSLSAGAGTNGVISGLDGTILATAIHGAAGYPGSVSTKLIQFCTAVCDYLMTNASVTFLPGTVTGSCPIGAGPLSAGAAVGGTFL